MALTRNDLVTVAGKLYQARADWKRLGSVLLREDKLDAIAQESGDERDHLRSVLKHWLIAEPAPTWAALINALKKIGQGSLAHKLEAMPRVFVLYCKDPPPGKTTLQLCDEVLDLADLLNRVGGFRCECDHYHAHKPIANWSRWTEGRIKESEFVLLLCSPMMNECLTSPTHELVEMAHGKFFADAIQTYIAPGKFIPAFLNGSRQLELVPRILHTVTHYELRASVLMSRMSDTSGMNIDVFAKQVTELLGEPEFRDIVHLLAFLRGEAYTRPPQPPKPIPLPPPPQTAICRDVSETRDNIKRLEHKYRDLVSKVQKVIQQKAPDVIEFRRSIQQLPVALKEEHRLFMETHAPKICRATTIDEIICHLDLYWNYLNYGLLEYIEGIYGDDETKQRMKEYRDEVEAFMTRTSLAAFYDAQPIKQRRKRHYAGSALQEDLKYFEFEHGRLTMNSSLQAANEFRQELAMEYSLHPFALILYEIKRSSVVIVLSTSFSVASYLQSRIQVSFLRKYNILEVKVNKDIIYHLGRRMKIRSKSAVRYHIQDRQETGDERVTASLPTPVGAVTHGQSVRPSRVRRRRISSVMRRRSKSEEKPPRSTHVIRGHQEPPVSQQAPQPATVSSPSWFDALVQGIRNPVKLLPQPFGGKFTVVNEAGKSEEKPPSSTHVIRGHQEPPVPQQAPQPATVSSPSWFDALVQGIRNPVKVLPQPFGGKFTVVNEAGIDIFVIASYGGTILTRRKISKNDKATINIKTLFPSYCVTVYAHAESLECMQDHFLLTMAGGLLIATGFLAPVGSTMIRRALGPVSGIATVDGKGATIARHEVKVGNETTIITALVKCSWERFTFRFRSRYPLRPRTSDEPERTLIVTLNPKSSGIDIPKWLKRPSQFDQIMELELSSVTARSLAV